MRRTVQQVRFALAVSLLASSSACNPGAFDDLIDGERADSGAGEGGRKDGGGRTPRDSGQPDARTPEMDGAAAVAGDGGSGRDGSAAPPDAAPGDGSVGPSDAGPAGCPSVVDASNVRLTTTDLGVIPIPMWITTRGVTASAAVGDRVVWTFTVPGDRHMVAWSDTEQPLQSPPQLNEQAPFVSVFPAAADPEPNPNLPLALTSVVGVNDDDALLFYTKLYYFNSLSIGILRLRRDQLQAEVVRPLDLFPPAEEGEPGSTPWRPLYSAAPIIEQTDAGPLLYLYACHSNPNRIEEKTGLLAGPCRVARVAVADVAHHLAFKHWNGSDWVDDPAQAVPVITGVTSGGLSVSFNRYLGKYLAAHSGTADNVMLRSADRPEGPWATLGSFGTLPGGGLFGTSLGATEHAALRDACQRVIYVTYTRVIETTDETGAVVTLTESRLVRVELE